MWPLRASLSALLLTSLLVILCDPTPQARPMLELIWAPLLGAFSLLFDEYSDPRWARGAGVAVHCWGLHLHTAAGARLLVSSKQRAMRMPGCRPVSGDWKPLMPPTHASSGPLIAPLLSSPPPRLLSICLSGFASCACLAASLGVTGLRDVFVTSLCNFTGLHSPGSMKPKNALAFRALLRVAVSVGDGLEDRCARPAAAPRERLRVARVWSGHGHTRL